MKAGDPEGFIRFKQVMLPKVGEKVQVTGKLQIGKMGWWLSFNGWGAYIYATTNADIPKDNDLNQFEQREVTVTGTLRHRDAIVTDGTATGIPEHFYFDVAETVVVPALQ